MAIKEFIKKFIPYFLLDFYHYFLALAGAFLYGFPSKKIIVIGVTGTGGKTTVVDLTAKILEQAGHKTACLSSIKFKIGNKERVNNLKMTMPGRMKIQKFLKQALKSNCKYVVLEVTSEGIKQFRSKFIDFDIALFTNLSPEHIESHKGFENYKQAKLKLFKSAKKVHIVNLDDKNTDYFLEIPAEQKYGYTTANLSALKLQQSEQQNLEVLRAEDIKIGADGISFEIQGILFHLSLLGKFNIYNSLAAVCVGLSQGVSLEDCRVALSKVQGVSGRMEIIKTDPFAVIVDYAHTPDSLLNVYQTLSKLKSKNQASKIICVLGSCGGGRDKWKRPEIGKIAFKYCDEIFITNEDPYDEDPMEIINQVAQGAQGKAYKILDRREAIRKALNMAQSNDLVIITGKGSEPWMCVENGKKIAWDDREIVRQELSH